MFGTNCALPGRGAGGLNFFQLLVFTCQRRGNKCSDTPYVVWGVSYVTIHNMGHLYNRQEELQRNGKTKSKRDEQILFLF